jgi:pimeloyl-ACP methyl ester carboxylesterase
VTDALLHTPHGAALETLVSGAGDPVTVFAHGLGCTIPETRPLGSGVGGTRIFFSFRGHGRSSVPPAGFGYGELATDLRAVADAYGATRAVATSMGAAALCRVLADEPDRFERLVFFTPAILDEPRLDEPRHDTVRRDVAAVLDAVAAGDRAALTAAVRTEVPAGAVGTSTGEAFVRQRVAALLGSGVAAAYRAVPGNAPPLPPGADALRAVTAPALVLACRGDALHPVPVAERLAALLPNAGLYVYDQPDVLWTARADLRRRISGFLG